MIPIPNATYVADDSSSPSKVHLTKVKSPQCKWSCDGKREPLTSLYRCHLSQLPQPAVKKGVSTLPWY